MWRSFGEFRLNLGLKQINCAVALQTEAKTPSISQICVHLLKRVDMRGRPQQASIALLILLTPSETTMTKFTSTLMLTLAACTLCAVPAVAQSSYGGDSYRNQPSVDKMKLKKIEKAKKDAAKLKAKQEAMKADGMKADGMKADAMKGDAMKADTMTKTYGSDKTYGSATPASPAAMEKTMAAPAAASTSYGSGTAVMAKPTNCPAGTDPQENGTCMLRPGS